MGRRGWRGKAMGPRLLLMRSRSTFSTFRIGISEGKNRQVRRMCRTAGLELLDLYREQIGALIIDVKEGKWRYLNKQEANLVFK